MTVESTQTRVSYAGDGVVTTFPVPFPCLDETDLVVILRDANGVEDVAVLDSDYTVAADLSEIEWIRGDPVVPPAVGEVLMIMRVLPLKQEIDYTEHDPFPAESHETGLDRGTMVAQQLQEQINRALLLPRSASQTGVELPRITPNKLLGYNAAGTGVSLFDTETVEITEIDHIGNYDGSLETAVSEIGTTPQTLLINQAVTLEDDVIVPATLHLMFLKEGRVVLGDYDLTVNGPLMAGLFQIFDCSGTGIVTFGSGAVKEFYPQWWGENTTPGTTDMSTAFHAAIVAAAGKPVRLIPDTYLLSTISAKTFDTDICLIGSDPDCTILDGNGDQNFYVAKTGYDNYRAHFYGLKFQDFNVAIPCQATSNTIAHLKVDNCIFYDCVYAGIRLACKISSAEIINSRFDTIGPSTEAHGILLGSNEYADQDSLTKYIIKDNKFKDITATASPHLARAILAYGREVIITDNIIDTVEVGSNEAGGEGIYIKCRYSNITNNVLINAGSTLGWIVIKGSNRGVTSTPQGFANVVANNNLYSTNESAYDTGIFVSNDSVLVTGNHIEGLCGAGIITAAVELDDISITNNKITGTRGDRSISLMNYGRNLLVSGNQITRLLGSYGPQTYVYGIYYYQTYGDAYNVRISDNQIDEHNESTSTGGFIAGIYVRVDSADTVTDLLILNNSIHIAHGTQSEYPIYIYTLAGSTIAGLKIRYNDVNTDALVPLYFNFGGTVSNYVFESAELGETSIMTGNETFKIHQGHVFIKDPGGAGRTFNPNTSVNPFPIGFQVTVVNTADAAETITFDSTVLNQAIAQGERGIFVYDGTNWRKVYVGS
jgi:hypothetical protein